MKTLNRKPVILAVAAALLGTGAVLGIASAQEEVLPEVVVEAGPVTKTVVGRSMFTGAPVERTAVDYHVSYADLDLVKHADVLTLQRRIEDAASSACGQIDELFPLDKSYEETHDCRASAVRSAAPQLQQAIEDAQSN